MLQVDADVAWLPCNVRLGTLNQEVSVTLPPPLPLPGTLHRN